MPIPIPLAMDLLPGQPGTRGQDGHRDGSLDATPCQPAPGFLPACRLRKPERQQAGIGTAPALAGGTQVGVLDPAADSRPGHLQAAGDFRDGLILKLRHGLLTCVASQEDWRRIVIVE